MAKTELGDIEMHREMVQAVLATDALRGGQFVAVEKMQRSLETGKALQAAQFQILCGVYARNVPTGKHFAIASQHSGVTRGDALGIRSRGGRDPK